MGRGRKGKGGNRPGRKVILHLLRDEVPSRRLFSVCSLATERQPSITEFRSYQNVSGVVDTRQESHSSLSLHLFFLRGTCSSICLFLSLSLPLFSSFPLVHGYRMAIVEIFIVHGRGEEGDRLTVRAGSSFLTNWSAGNCPSPGATCWDPG